MAGPTTAQRGAAGRADTPARPPHIGPEERRLSRRTLLILIGVAAALLTAFVIWVLYGSSWLRVERVTTTGTEVLTREEVEAVAAVPLGAPLISVDTGAMEGRLLQKLPRIDSVDVVRSWPHGISLKVAERKPVLLVEKGAKFVEVDGTGSRFATVDRAPEGVPLLELRPERSASLRRFDSDRLSAEAVLVAGELPKRLVKEVKAVRITSYDGISLRLTRGRTVIWGSSEDGQVKARVLAALMKADPKAGQFDVSVPSAPAVSGS
ncbi:FtsQ-type POTRA domain-containing protein [Streptomyces sp. ISL-111]|uniref:cell division protein FtsQ/DivIB n=1 Tax=Streptomyces sp. ISL-111 TaxID=2819175 RepID=UPI001BE78664|nr:FtsQ-type POTRA domain-containing protein [Streptomyces sp. ISL-111]MBT2377123.1 FtsQ-type POTRA domain-containing protein [Streptomyces sp. ISL-111]